MVHVPVGTVWSTLQPAVLEISPCYTVMFGIYGVVSNMINPTTHPVLVAVPLCGWQHCRGQSDSPRLDIAASPLLRLKCGVDAKLFHSFLCSLPYFVLLFNVVPEKKKKKKKNDWRLQVPKWFHLPSSDGPTKNVSTTTWLCDVMSCLFKEGEWTVGWMNDLEKLNNSSAIIVISDVFFNQKMTIDDPGENWKGEHGWIEQCHCDATSCSECQSVGDASHGLENICQFGHFKTDSAGDGLKHQITKWHVTASCSALAWSLAVST